MTLLTSRTVGDFLQQLFPRGTRPSTAESSSAWVLAPLTPADIFAAGAGLLQKAGAYHHLISCNCDKACSAQQGCAEFALLSVHASVRTKWINAAKQFTDRAGIPGEVAQHWAAIVKAWGDPIFSEASVAASPDVETPRWWLPATGLVIIADEAARDVGWQVDEDSPWFASFVDLHHSVVTGGKWLRPPSICTMADPDVACVQPKSHTPMVGLGLRTLTHNLALLPPRGEVSTNWICPPQPYRVPDDTIDSLNILLVPFPFEIRDEWWGSRVRDKKDQLDVRWGGFTLRQGWMERGDGTHKIAELIDFTKELVRQAKRNLKTIHGIVFPEYALTEEAFVGLTEAIKRDAESWDKISCPTAETRHRDPLHDVEFIVAGASDYNGMQGNFVFQSGMLKHQDNHGQVRRQTYMSARSKHHRWILDRSQLQSYALERVLDPKMRWAENLMVHGRKIDTYVFREGSVFTSMICEDLARSDPCLDVLRDLGPNLIFVLLMDGPQTPTRWSARYAQALSDDPGCAVLNLTSLGLIERSNGTGIYPRSRSIGLFRGGDGRMHEIICPERSHGVVVSLLGQRKPESTLDGRITKEAVSWRFERYTPVRVEDRSIRRKLLNPDEERPGS